MKMGPFGDPGRRGCLGAGCGGGEAGRSARPRSVAGRPGAPAPTEAVRGRGWRRVAHRSWPLRCRVSAAAAWMSAATVAARRPLLFVAVVVAVAVVAVVVAVVVFVVVVVGVVVVVRRRRRRRCRPRSRRCCRCRCCCRCCCRRRCRCCCCCCCIVKV